MPVRDVEEGWPLAYGVGDLNGDGLDDVAVVEQFIADQAEITIFYGATDNLFAEPGWTIDLHSEYVGFTTFMSRPVM